jgi:hypothetical protein
VGCGENGGTPLPPPRSPGLGLVFRISLTTCSTECQRKRAKVIARVRDRRFHRAR